MALGRWITTPSPKIGRHSVAMGNVDGQNPGGSAEQRRETVPHCWELGG
jgi:hypothetical protein